ncbi:MAG: hypothetical protein ACFFBD_22085, partial [Candidatus Hodarchaeota archaeon]
ENILDRLADRFLKEYPNMLENVVIDPTAFKKFTKTCDEILKRQVIRKGFSFLLQIALEPFITSPVNPMPPKNQEYQKALYSLQNELRKWARKNSSEKRKLFQEPFIIFLPEIEQFAYILALNWEQTNGTPTHLLCFAFEEENFFLFYQLMPLIHYKATQIFPALSKYLKNLEIKAGKEREKVFTQIQEIVEIWGDLNGYTSGLEVSLFEEFYKSVISSEILTKEQIILQLHKLFMKLGENLDKVFFAILTQQRILFTGKNPDFVKQSLSTLSMFYPQASVTLWTNEPSKSLLIGTHPDNLHHYDDENPLIINLDVNQVKNGEKNGFCTELSEKIRLIAQKSGINEARTHFQTKIASLFILIKVLMKADITEEKGQEQLQKHLKNYALPTIQLVERMTKNLNYLVHEITQEYFNLLLHGVDDVEGLPEKIVIAYCHVCDQILRIPIKIHSQARYSSGGVWKYVYVHENDARRSHGLMLYLDEEFAIQQASIINIALEALPPQESFEIEAYCQLCQQELKIPVDSLKFNLSIEAFEFYEQAFIHGYEPHTLTMLLDNNKQVRRAELTDLDIATSGELLRITVLEDVYTVLHTRSLPPSISSIFEELLIFDRESKTVSIFHSTKPYTVSKIAEQMEETIKTLEATQMHSFLLSIKNVGEALGIISDGKNICIVGIGFEKSYIRWLENLLTVISHKRENPNTLGLEIVLRLMENRKQPLEASTLQDILYSPLFAIKFTFKYQELFERLFERLTQLFPDTADHFQACALGKKSFLETLNTEVGYQYFDQFIQLFNYVERRGLF